jgi:hypothetical protein
VVRLIFKGVPISKQYLENLPITLNRTPSSSSSFSYSSSIYRIFREHEHENDEFDPQVKSFKP